VAEHAGVAVLELSQEMPDVECGNRAIASIGRVDYGRLESGRLHRDDWSRVADAVDVAKSMPWWIDDQPGLRLSEIRTKCRIVKREAAAAGVRLGVVVVDYVQLCVGDEDMANRNLELAAISSGLKTMAKELDLCVVLLSQLNREAEKRSGQEPIMSDLRDSGGLEQDADVIAFLWPIGERDATGNRVLGWKLAKNRQGQLLRMCLTFAGALQQWSESDVHPDAAMAAAAKARAAAAKGAEL
jgi:replicative DNA helicase